MYVASGAGGAVILCDSCYTTDMLDERATPKSNVALVRLGKELLSRVRQQRAVTFVHVKVHSGDPGNDRVDELVQWGKQDSDEYARFREDGTGEGASRVAPFADYEAVRDARKRAVEDAKFAREQAGIAVRERRRRIRAEVDRAAEVEDDRSALISVSSRLDWDTSLGIESHRMAEI